MKNFRDVLEAKNYSSGDIISDVEAILNKHMKVETELGDVEGYATYAASELEGPAITATGPHTYDIYIAWEAEDKKDAKIAAKRIDKDFKKLDINVKIDVVRDMFGGKEETWYIGVDTSFTIVPDTRLIAEKIASTLRLRNTNIGNDFVSGRIEGWVLPDDTSDWCICKVLSSSKISEINNIIEKFESDYKVRIYLSEEEKGYVTFSIEPGIF